MLEVAQQLAGERQDPRNDTLLNEQPAPYAKLADSYAAEGQWELAVKSLKAVLDRLQKVESRRALKREEVRERQTDLVKLALWNRK